MKEKINNWFFNFMKLWVLAFIFVGIFVKGNEGLKSVLAYGLGVFMLGALGYSAYVTIIKKS
ncbi:hypothetical protein [Anaerosolibacter sp.]|uniref:hypothetical protein n=1 Tax=Anaerosolibacter sp. TaxID=1872527 RepID=UPI0039EE8428